jgi:hypothetical protein
VRLKAVRSCGTPSQQWRPRTDDGLWSTSSDLAEVVADDLFTAETTVTGSLTYDTSIGGSATVPQLPITKITITGSTA